MTSSNTDWNTTQLVSLECNYCVFSKPLSSTSKELITIAGK